MQQIGLSNQRLKVVWFVIYPCFSYVLSTKYVSLNPNLKKKILSNAQRIVISKDYRRIIVLNFLCNY